MTVLRAFLALTLMCAASVSVAEDASALAALQAAKAKWAAAGVESYSFVVSYSCFCFSRETVTPALVNVRKGEIRRATYTARVPGHPDGRVPRDNRLRVTVQDLFRMIEDSLHSDSELIIAKYDETLGFPVQLAIDDVPEMSDSDYGYEVSRFRR